MHIFDSNFLLLASLQKEHPGIVVSVKTQHAGRRILNDIRDKIVQLSKEGSLDETESAILLTVSTTNLHLLFSE